MPSWYVITVSVLKSAVINKQTKLLQYIYDVVHLTIYTYQDMLLYDMCLLTSIPI